MKAKFSLRFVAPVIAIAAAVGPVVPMMAVQTAVAAGETAAPTSGGAKKPWTIDDMMKLRDISDTALSPDGKWVAFVVSEADDKENAFNTDLYLARTGIAPSGAATTQASSGTRNSSKAKDAAAATDAGRSAGADTLRLTRSPKADHSPRFSPDGKTIAFLSAREIPSSKSDEEKGEQVWMIRPDGGEAWLPGTTAGSVSDLEWSPDGTTLALLVREPKSADRLKREKDKDDATVVDGEIRRNQVWLMDARSGASIQVTRGAIHYTDLDWSPDGKTLAIAGQPTPKVPDTFSSDIYTLDLPKAFAALRDEMRKPAPPKEKEEAAAADPNAAPSPTPPALAEPHRLVASRGEDSDPRWSPDGREIVFVTQNGNDEWFTNSYVAIASVPDGKVRVLSQGLDEAAENVHFPAGGNLVLFDAPARLSNHLYRVATDIAQVVALTRGDAVNRNAAVSRDGRAIAFVRESPLEPPEVYAAEMPVGPRFQNASRITSINAWADSFATLPKEAFHWKGAGGMEMEGILVKPAGCVSGRRYPLLTVVHGGPAGVFTNSFTVRRGVYPVQLFAQAGYAVFLPNPRGSGGYGEAFRKANVRDWGEKDYEDIMAGVDAIVASGLADESHLGVMGWSYGGFMTSRIITKTSRFAAASVGAGVTNTFSFTGQSDIPDFMRSYFGAWPWDEPSIYTSRTALFNAKGVKTPTLIQHGESDVRVPLPQGWELYVALSKQGVPVEFVTYPRQGHGLSEPKLIRDAMKRNLDWFSRWILGGKSS